MKTRIAFAIIALVVLLALCGLCGGIALIVMLSPSRPSVLKRDADRIEVGMTLDEVAAIIGPSHVNHVRTRNLGGAAKGRMHLWNVHEPEGTLSIIVNDADSRVVQKTFNPGEQIPWWATPAKH